MKRTIDVYVTETMKRPVKVDLIGAFAVHGDVMAVLIGGVRLSRHWFTVSHVGCGKMIEHGFTRKQAIDLVRELNALPVDWSTVDGTNEEQTRAALGEHYEAAKDITNRYRAAAGIEVRA